MINLLLTILLLTTGCACGQNGLPLSFPGTCIGSQTDVHDLSAIQDTPAVKCNSLIVAELNGQTLLSFSNGDPKNPVLMFSGELLTVHSQEHFNPYIGPLTLAFPIDRVLWGDGNPAMSVQAGEHLDKLAARGCYFHFIDQGWEKLRMVECELIMDTPNHKPRRVAVAFHVEEKFTVDQQEVSVIYGLYGANDFETIFNKEKIQGTCGFQSYTVDGVLKRAEPNTPMGRLFRTVCYRDAGKLNELKH